MNTIQVNFPDHYDEFSEFEHEHKGHLWGIEILSGKSIYHVSFYDTARLTQEIQDIADEIKNGGKYGYIDANILLLPKVNKQCINAALLEIGPDNLAKFFVPTITRTDKNS